MKKQLLVALLGTALVLPIAAQAEGAYVGVNVGSAETKVSGGGETGKDSDTGAKLYAGYDFSKNFGVEAGYANLGKPKDSDGNASASIEPTSFYIAGTGSFPMNDQFSLFAKVGLSANRAKLSATVGNISGSEKFNNTAAIIGVGAAYNFSKNIALVAEYENFGKVFDKQGADAKSDMLSIGLRYKF